MRYPQVLVYETDGRLARLLRRGGKPRAWSLREPRGLESCLRLLRHDEPTVLVIKLGKDLIRELQLLERVTWLFPDTAAVVVMHTADPALARLAWELGAGFVVLPPLVPQEFLDVITGLMKSVIDRMKSQRGEARGEGPGTREGKARTSPLGPRPSWGSNRSDA